MAREKLESVSTREEVVEVKAVVVVIVHSTFRMMKPLAQISRKRKRNKPSEMMWITTQSPSSIHPTNHPAREGSKETRGRK